MVKKIVALSDWLSASDAAQLLSQKYDRRIDPRYIRSLSKRSKNPVRTQDVGNRLLYYKEDILACNIRERTKKAG